MIKNILLVCTGNVCRSPMACGFFRTQLFNLNSDITVTSAGVKSLVGDCAAPQAQIAMKQIGIDISGHRAKQLTEELVGTSDLILVMEKQHVEESLFLFPYARGKIFLLGEWSDFEVPDPCGRSSDFFLHVRNLIERGFQDWLGKI
jgi:protein-tyrosine phosphatase